MKPLIPLTICLGGLLAFGCENTAEGVKKDSEIGGQKAAESAQNLSKGMNEAGKDIGAATMLTPKIKLAISAEKSLNDPANLIDVNSTDDKVTLEGHVTSEALKALAGDVAAKAIKDNGARQTLVNQLVIKP